MGKELSRSFDIEVVNREYKLVGLCETGNFPDAFLSSRLRFNVHSGIVERKLNREKITKYYSVRSCVMAL